VTATAQFVFGYGSLAAAAGVGRRARLRDHRRVWGVAMDNRVDISGYKSYRRAQDGSRPAVYVAFLDIVEDAGAAVDGVLLAVDDGVLRALDARERNYDRIDVTAAVAHAPGTVWSYRGSDAGRARLRAGLRAGSAVVDAAYLAAVQATFSALGIDEDVRPGAGLPALSLQRVDLPPQSPG
jgi:Gamma-glutamyl cyclotransferase, AIG2-like